MSSPTQRTLEECRARKMTACVVEKWIPQTRRRADAFGFGDVLAVHRAPDDPRAHRVAGAVLIQACRAADMSTRARKIVTECADAARAWLEAGNSIEVWGWSKRAKPVERKFWRLRRVEVVLVAGERYIELSCREVTS